MTRNEKPISPPPNGGKQAGVPQGTTQTPLPAHDTAADWMGGLSTWTSIQIAERTRRKRAKDAGEKK